MKNMEEIAKRLEEGVKAVFTSEGYANYLTFLGKFHRYSIMNTMLIYAQFPKATMVAGYTDGLNKHHRYVKKGEKSIRILAPVPRKFEKKVLNEDGEEEIKKVEYTDYISVGVFDVSQTEGEDLPEVVKDLKDSVVDYEALEKKLRAVSPVEIAMVDDLAGAKGRFNNQFKNIEILSGMSEQQTIKTMIHEIAHSLLHDKDNGEEKEADRRTKEVQAESVAYLVCNQLGIDTGDYSFGYIATWSKGREAKELFASMTVIQKTAEDILRKIEVA